MSLSLAGNTTRPGVKRGQLERLPTWAPDWSDAQELDLYQLNEPESTFSAWGGLGLSPGGMLDWPASELRFRGIIVDRVDRIACYLPPRRPADRLNVAAANSFFSEWYDWVQSKLPARYKGDKEKYVEEARTRWSWGSNVFELVLTLQALAGLGGNDSGKRSLYSACL